MGTRGWSAAIAACALVLGGTVIGTQFASGATVAEETVFVPVAPCRLVDTRPTFDTNVGPRSTKLGAGEEQIFTAWETGDADSTCEIPVTATAISTNTTAVSPTARTFIALFPSDIANPGTSNLNVPENATPTPNAVTVPLSAAGAFTVFNNAGTVDVLVDVNGYFQPSTSVGATGPAGADGATGPAGPANCLTDELIQANRWDLDPCREVDATGPSFARAIQVANGKLYVVDRPNSEVDVFDAETGAALTTITGFADPVDVVFDGTNLNVLTFGGGGDNGTITVINPATDAPVGAPIDLGGEFNRQMTVGNGSIYVVQGNSVVVVDIATRAIADMTGSTAGESNLIAFTGDRVYIHDFDAANLGTPKLHVFDIATNAQIGTIDPPLPAEFSDLSFNGEYLFAALGANVFVIDPTAAIADDPYVDTDPSTTMVVDGIPTAGANAGSLATDGKYLYVTQDNDTYSTIDTTSFTNLGFEGVVTLPGTDGIADLVTFDGQNVWTIDSAGSMAKHRPS